MLVFDVSVVKPTYSLPTATVSSQSQARPIQVELLGQIAVGWHLVQPLTVWIQQDEDGEYLVNDEIFYVYGEGATIAEGQRGYVRSLIEYYSLATEHEGDAPSRDLLAELHRYLRRT